MRTTLVRMLAHFLEPSLSLFFSELTCSQIRFRPENPSQNAAVAFHRTHPPAPHSSHLPQGELASPPGEPFSCCLPGWLYLTGGWTRCGTGHPAELSGWETQTTSKGALGDVLPVIPVPCWRLSAVTPRGHNFPPVSTSPMSSTFVKSFYCWRGQEEISWEYVEDILM